jgi:hypothetical protein
VPLALLDPSDPALIDKLSAASAMLTLLSKNNSEVAKIVFLL